MREPGTPLCQPRKMVWGIHEPTPYQRSTGEVVHVQGVDFQFQVNAICVLRAVRDATAITAQLISVERKYQKCHKTPPRGTPKEHLASLM